MKLAATEVAVAGIALATVARLKLSEVFAAMGVPLIGVAPRVSVTRTGVVIGTKAEPVPPTPV